MQCRLMDTVIVFKHFCTSGVTEDIVYTVPQFPFGTLLDPPALEG